MLLQLERTAQIVALGSLALVAAYPFMKRITWWPQAWLGLVFAWGALVGWPAVTGRLGTPALWLYAGTVAWVIGYDTLYAIQDIEDDALVGVKSSARRLGDQAPLGVAIFYALAVVLWSAAIWSVRPDWVALLALLPAALHLANQALRADPEDGAGALRAVPLQPQLRPAGVSGDAGGRPFEPLGAATMLSIDDARRAAQALVERAVAAGADAADAIYVGERSSSVAGAPRRARAGQSLRRRGDWPAPVPRPELGDASLRPILATRRWRRWSIGRWRWPRRRPRTNMPASRPSTCSIAASCRRSTPTMGRSRIRPR